MKINTLLLIALLICYSCKTNDDDNLKDIPDCVQEIIDGILQETVSEPKRAVMLYDYNGSDVFAISPKSNVTEPAIQVIDKSCNTICLIGGIDGSDNDCPDFQNAELIETVWTDPR